MRAGAGRGLSQPRMITAYRIVKSRHADSSRAAFDGEGARLFGGRFNSPGTAVVYAAGSESLAILEVVVHLEDAGILPSYSLCAATFDEGVLERLDETLLPEGWRSEPPLAAQAIGDAWVKEERSAVLEVPSAVVPRERNYLINPLHPDFYAVQLSEPEPFAFDERLL